MKNIYILLCSIFILLCFGSENLSKAASHTLTTSKIAIVYSYDLEDNLSNVERDRVEFFQKKFPTCKVRSFMLKADGKTQGYQLHNTIKKLQARLDDYKPDYILTVDSEAFEYYYVPYIAKKKNKHGIFLNVPDYVYKNVYEHYNLKENTKYLSGSVVKTDFPSIEKKLYLDKKFVQQIYLLKSNTPEDNLLASEIVSQTKTQIVIKEVSSIEDLKTVLRNIQTEDSLVLTSFKSLKNGDKNRLATNGEIVQVFKDSNTKGVALSLRMNLTKAGFGSSYVNDYDASDLSLPINKLISDKVNKKLEAKVITMNSKKVID